MFLILLILRFCGTAYAASDFADCLKRLQQGYFGQDVKGAVNASGHSVSNVALAVGLTYQACVDLCGSGHEAFDKDLFTQQLAAWLLPWLALISQLPYGGNDGFKNFESMVITVGSPMLAAYSLTLAVTSNRWMVERFRRSNHPNGRFFAAKIMSSLQQVFVSLPKENHILWSLVVLRENDEWWKKVADELDYSSSRWTLAAIMSMAYVALAYGLTWMNALNGNSNRAYPSGQSLGSLWLSLLPLVVCYLQLSPKSNLDQISSALETANKEYYVAEDNGEPTKCHLPLTITIQTAKWSMIDEDRICPTPVCFYTRFYTWFRATSQLSDAFDAASQRASMGAREPRTREEVIEYCSKDSKADNTFDYDLANIYVKSVMLAIFLQWGTTGAAIMAMYLTPTTGLGCRSGSQLLYGSLATLTCICLVVSDVLSHSFAASQNNTRLRKFIGVFAIVLRQIGKSLAVINTGWIFTSSFLQFSNAENTCYCKTTALSLGSKAYGSLVYTQEQEEAAKLFWAGGIIMATGTAIVFTVTIGLLTLRPKEQNRTVIHEGQEYIPLTAQSTSVRTP